MANTHLKGKNAIVTGGAGGVGSVVVRRFVEEGMNVLATVARGTDTLAQGAIAMKVDVTSEKEVEALFARGLKEFGSIDIMVNTVGGYLPVKPLSEVTLAEWEAMMEKNLKTAFLCTRAAVRAMKGKDYGRIINFSAKIGLRPTAGRAPYSVSKASISLLTEIVSLELHGTGITVNAIAPGIIATAANKESMPKTDMRGWVSPESMADLIAWLCSEEGNAVTGTTLRT